MEASGTPHAQAGTSQAGKASLETQAGKLKRSWGLVLHHVQGLGARLGSQAGQPGKGAKLISKSEKASC